MKDRVASMSDEGLISALLRFSEPLVRELARRGYNVRLDAPAPAASDGVDFRSLFEFEQHA